MKKKKIFFILNRKIKLKNIIKKGIEKFVFLCALFFITKKNEKNNITVFQ